MENLIFAQCEEVCLGQYQLSILELFVELVNDF